MPCTCKPRSMAREWVPAQFLSAGWPSELHVPLNQAYHHLCLCVGCRMATRLDQHPLLHPADGVHCCQACVMMPMCWAWLLCLLPDPQLHDDWSAGITHNMHQPTHWASSSGVELIIQGRYTPLAPQHHLQLIQHMHLALPSVFEGVFV